MKYRTTVTKDGAEYDLTSPEGVKAAFEAGVNPVIENMRARAEMTLRNGTVPTASGGAPLKRPSNQAKPAAKTSVHFRNAVELAEASATVDDVKAEWEAVGARMDYLERATDGREPLASERTEFDKLAEIRNSIESMPIMQQVDRSGVVAPVEDTTPAYKSGYPLAKGQTFTGAVKALNLDRDERPRYAGHEEDEPFNLAKTLKNAMSGGSGGAGGFALPTILTADLIDLARNKARVLEAGARIVPMANRTVDVPKWATDPEPGWRGENDPIVEDDGAIDKLTLSAHTLAVVTRVSRELIEDTNLEDDLKAAFAAAFGLKIDLAALYGSGADDEPLGVKNTAGVTKTPMATNGAVPTWDALVESVGRLRDVNEEPNAQILSDRTARYLSLLKETGTGAYLRAPEYLDGVQRLTTGQVPNNLTVGTSGATTSDVFTADWAQLYIGVRTQLQITLLSERYMPDAGQYGFVAWWRGDVQVARSKAFDVVTGIKAA